MTDPPTHEGDDVLTLPQLNQKWVGKMLRHREAPEGYEVNIGRTFVVGEAMYAGQAMKVMVRESHGFWVPLDHCEQVAVVEFGGDPGSGDTVLLSAAGMSCIRVHLNQGDQTVARLLGQFEKATDWLRVADRLKRNVKVGVE